MYIQTVMILDEIIFNKRQEVTALKIALHRLDLKNEIKKLKPAKDFLAAVSAPLAVIAEVKKASPSAGIIRPDFDPVKIAKEYEKAGASAISVLTDQKYFKGSIEDLKKVAKAVKIPVLRKDFIIDDDQIFEARLAGADAILLIVAVLDDDTLSEFVRISRNLSMQTIVEVHNEKEMERALNTPTKIIGVNNRDLKTFKVDVNTSVRLAALVPANRKITLISESGIRSSEDAKKIQEAGFDAMLIGEELMKSKDVENKMKELSLKK